MGMFDRDPNFGENFSEGDRFVLTDAKYVGTIQTRNGPAEKSMFQIVSREHPTEKRWYTALGVGFANQARRVERGDLPAVVEYVVIPLEGEKTVKRLAEVNVEPRAFIDGDDGPKLDPLTTVAPAEAGEAAEGVGF